MHQSVHFILINKHSSASVDKTEVTLPLLTVAALASWLALASLASCARVAAIRLSCASS